jgi:dTDP-4-dehydrorhamnose 3,5-epimerase
MVQANLSVSRQHVVRGMHFHRRQADYWCVLDGEAFVALHDLRRGSPTEGIGWSDRFAASDGLRGLYVPPGVAHGFCAITDMRLHYLVDAYFEDAADEFGFAWNDADAAISWPETSPLLSARDRANPSLADASTDAPPFVMRDRPR